MDDNFGSNNFNNSNDNTTNMFTNEGSISEFVGRDKIIQVNTGYGNVVRDPDRYYSKEIPTKTISLTSLLTALLSLYKIVVSTINSLKENFHLNNDSNLITGNINDDFFYTRLSNLNISDDTTNNTFSLPLSQIFFIVVLLISVIVFTTLFRLIFTINGKRIEKIGPNIFLESGSKRIARRIYISRFKTECEYCSRNGIANSELKIKYFSFKNSQLYWKCDETNKHNIPFDRSVYGKLA